MLKRGRLIYRTKKLKIGAWVNDFMMTNTLMKIPLINCFPVMAMPTKTHTPRNDNVFKIDTESATIGIDNRCSICILNITEDFIGELRESKRKSENLEELSNLKLRQGLSYGDGKMTKDRNINV